MGHLEGMETLHGGDEAGERGDLIRVGRKRKEEDHDGSSWSGRRGTRERERMQSTHVCPPVTLQTCAEGGRKKLEALEVLEPVQRVDEFFGGLPLSDIGNQAQIVKEQGADAGGDQRLLPSGKKREKSVSFRVKERTERDPRLTRTSVSCSDESADT